MKKGLMAFALTLFVVGCAPNSAEQIQEGTVEEVKNELVLALGSEPDTGFDPTTGWGRYGSPLFQSTLFKRDNNLEVDYDLATDYELSSDGLVWTVVIRDDAVFSDGEPLTASDVKFTYETAKESGSILDLTMIDEIRVEDDLTIQFHLVEPQSTFIHTLISIGIVPEHAYDDDYAQSPIGSGPFVFKQWDQGQQLIVEANPYYYGPSSEIEQITFVFLSEDSAFAAVQAGEVDVASVPAVFGLQEVAGMRVESMQSVDNRGIMFPFVARGETTEDGYPIGNDVTSDLAIRQAINMAVDRQALVDGVLEGFGTPGYSVVDGLPWWNPDTMIEDGDLEGAIQLLEENDWFDENEDGVREKEGLRAEFRLLYPSNDVTRQSLALAVADMLKPIGIQIDVEGKSWDEIIQLMHSEAVMFGWGSHDPLEMVHVYSVQYAGVDWFNPGYYANETVEHYFNQALTALTEEEAIDYWQQAQWDGKTGFSTLGDAPWAWLVNLEHVYFVHERLDIGEQPIQPHGHGWPITNNIAEWTWNE
ncbi:ABC transporter substrate-binding protein [Halalkalibacter sp. APA_J-10(15)]|uniref:ABC transporter substrate-binding protein n=1 Tax=unclassified Halalkalibacter TaxID=2893063 RepID=UPI001FF4B131|nr:ABC transporter substrate-binding protein [Halalkalibacter sp. APA_J-10(15)]MCK0472383.1 ABC transporter substrate-binding protein [Halalkalibacter sp. APA_J-10(15)]